MLYQESQQLLIAMICCPEQWIPTVLLNRWRSVLTQPYSCLLCVVLLATSEQVIIKLFLRHFLFLLLLFTLLFIFDQVILEFVFVHVVSFIIFELNYTFPNRNEQAVRPLSRSGVAGFGGPHRQVGCFCVCSDEFFEFRAEKHILTQNKF